MIILLSLIFDRKFNMWSNSTETETSNFEYSKNGFADNSNPYHHTLHSLLPSFSNKHVRLGYDPSVGPSIRSTKCHSGFIYNNYFRKVNFHVFLDPNLMLQNICLIKRTLPRRLFYRSRLTKHYTPIVHLDSLNFSLSKDLR